MAHQVQTMFSYKQTPWHGLGKIIHDVPTIAEGIKLAGLDWRVEQKPVFTLTPDGDYTLIPDKAALVRNDDSTTLAVLSPRYKALQNSEAFDFFQPFIDNKLASLETAGALQEGRKIWVLAKLNKAPIEIKGNDIVEKFVLLSNSHDGSTAVRVGFTPIRVVCANTLAMSHNAKDSQLMRVFHGSKVKENVEMLRDTINAIDASFEATEEQMKILARRQVGKEELKKYIKVVFKISEDLEDGRKKINAEKLEERITQLFDVSAGAQEAGHTYWGAYNAVNYYLNHEYGRSQDGRLDSIWFGYNSRVNASAFAEAVRAAV